MSKKAEPLTFGRKLKRLREKQGLGLEELAAQLNLKPSYLGKLERDEVLPPVAEIITIARHLAVEPSIFMGGSAPESVRDSRKKALEQRTRDYAYRLLTREGHEHHLMAFKVTIDPNSYHRKVAYRHPGEEFVYVLSGKLQIKVDQKAGFLGPGESIHFDSSHKHLLKNPGKDPTNLLVVIYNP